MRITTKYLMLSALVTPFLSGCGTGLLSPKVDEGVIEYALSFPDYDPDGIMAGMLPERTTVTFSSDKQVAELSAGMGIFRTAMVTDNKAKAMDYHLSLMSKKMVAHMLPRDLLVFNKDSGIPTILFTNDVDTIAGYPCKRAIAVFSKIDQGEIDLWYTDRIDMKNPNWFGPFADVPGVLLRYDVVQYGMRMRLDAISVQPGKVDPALFEVKADHDAVPAEVLHHELAEVLGTFSM
ncbi:MAG: hypothetical protein KDC00_00665 [Flavobacteriales bacterium]|nr:hypothetical protein [Flavobacteriales bacterium]